MANWTYFVKNKLTVYACSLAQRRTALNESNGINQQKGVYQCPPICWPRKLRSFEKIFRKM